MIRLVQVFFVATAALLPEVLASDVITALAVRQQRRDDSDCLFTPPLISCLSSIVDTAATCTATLGDQTEAPCFCQSVYGAYSCHTSYCPGGLGPSLLSGGLSLCSKYSTIFTYSAASTTTTTTSQSGQAKSTSDSLSTSLASSTSNSLATGLPSSTPLSSPISTPSSTSTTGGAATTTTSRSRGSTTSICIANNMFMGTVLAATWAILLVGVLL
ncbi:hypothetical protein GQ53DRAFT_134354 [Thozetella sp. PMI_491]|nr:hypothetical protein GQ53DRAFT_134354 [Thozetella sp. PMI_491]